MEDPLRSRPTDERAAVSPRLGIIQRRSVSYRFSDPRTKRQGHGQTVILPRDFPTVWERIP